MSCSLVPEEFAKLQARALLYPIVDQEGDLCFSGDRTFQPHLEEQWHWALNSGVHMLPFYPTLRIRELARPVMIYLLIMNMVSDYIQAKGQRM